VELHQIFQEIISLLWKVAFVLSNRVYLAISSEIAQQIPYEPLCWGFWHAISAQVPNESFIMRMNT
jgi:hypothetical protein